MKEVQLKDKKVLHVVVSKHGKFGGGENIVELYYSTFPNNTYVITNSIELSKRIGSSRSTYVNISNLSILNMGRLVFSILVLLRRYKFSSIISHHRYSTYASYIANKLSLRRIPVVHYIHYYTTTVSFIRYFISNFISVSQCLKDHWVSFHKVNLNDIYVLSNGTNLTSVESAELERFRTVNKIEQEGVRLCIVGRLDPIKGHLVLFNSILYLKDKLNCPLFLYVIGDGDIREELESYVSSHGLSNNIKFLGFVKGPQNYLSLFDVLVQPSFSEGLPFTLIEGMASRIKIVASNIPPNKEALGDDYKYLSQVGDHQDLSDIILDIISLSSQDSEDITDRLYEKYQNNFTQDKMLNSYVTYINKL